MRVRNWIVAMAALALIGMSAAYLLGFMTADRNIFPAEEVRTGVDRISRRLGLKKRGQLDGTASLTRTIGSVFLRLRLDELPVPNKTRGAGGAMTSVGDELLLMDHTGQVWLLSGTSLRPTKISVPSNGRSDYERAAASPKYAGLLHEPARLRHNDILYYKEPDGAALVVSYTEWQSSGECYGTTVARLPVPPDIASVADIEARPEDWQLIYRTRPCLPLKSTQRALEGHMAGGRMVYVGGHRIVLGSGDYHWDGLYGPEALAQKDEADYGKVLEIDLKSKAERILAKGVRNVQGVTLDRSGQVWTVEHGPRGGDELNRLAEGANYGWPEVTLGTRYNELPWPTSGPYGRHDGFKTPVFAWLPSVATSTITLIDGFHPAWDGDLLVGTLKGRMLIRLHLEEDHVVFAEPIPIGVPIRDVHMHSDGRIALWTDTHQLILISPDSTTPVNLLVEKVVDGLPVDEVRRQRLRSALSTCEECHSFDPTDSIAAPSLGKVYGYPIGSTGYASYSDALRSSAGEWDEESLMAFLTDPQAFAPGCTMPGPGLSSETIADLTEVLRAVAAPR